MKLSNTGLRIITGIIMAILLGIAFAVNILVPQAHSVRWLCVLIMIGAIIEAIKRLIETTKENFHNNAILFIGYIVWLFVMLGAAYVVGGRPWIILWLLMIIVGADVGGWLFGKIFGGDKMWPQISEHKTWAGQIGGIICGTGMSLMYGLLGTDIFMPELLWIGLGVSLLSQYGDLTASFIKRKLNIKDFGNILPGHGGIMDRFDGWIYVLPLIWFIIG